jgi:hypothetical protein
MAIKRISLRPLVLVALAATSLKLWAGGPQVMPLWEQGAPGFEERRNEPEQAGDYWVRNIHNPSLTVNQIPLLLGV